MARQVLENGVILPAEYSDDWYDDMTSNLTKLDDVIGSDSEKLSSADVGAAALSNNYNDLDNLPTIPTVNDATLTIQKNGVDVQTFTANASSNVTANITVPTKTSDITNDSNFVDTSNAAVASGITSSKVTSYDSHIADNDIHVTTADKNKWNNQSYVFRYSSTTLVASSTNSNSLLDNTDNLKVGDKVIDSSGVLFSITAIDTANSTFTIGTALIDLAQDSDVVHKSGNETIGGVKTFSDNPIIGNNNTNITISNRQIVANSSASTTGNHAYSYMQLKAMVNYADSSSPIDVTVGLDINEDAYADGKKSSLSPSGNNATNLGKSGKRWANVYATNYYYGGSEVEFSTKFVTTDTAQTVSGQKLFNDINAISSSAEIGVSAGNNSFKVVDKNKNIMARLEGGTFSTGMAYCYLVVNNGSNDFNGFSLYQASANLTQLRPYNASLNLQLGATNRYFSDCYTSKVNGVEPSSLSLPSGNANDVIDISSYITALDGTSNSYTVPANGWISISVIGTAIDIVSSSWSDSRLRASSGNVRMLYPVLKNETVDISVSGTTLTYARFIPCQGNV